MANDRMFLRCRACGDMLPLAKHYLDGWFNSVAVGEDMGSWIDKHAPTWVHETSYDEKLDSHAVFEICYESDAGYEAKIEQWQNLKKDLGKP